MLETWTLEIVVGLVTLQMLVLFYLSYRRRTGASDPNSDTDVDPDPDPGSEDRSSIECRSCGTENDPTYHYCRECVSDLDGESIPGYRSHSPSERSL